MGEEEVKERRMEWVTRSLLLMGLGRLGIAVAVAVAVAAYACA